MSVTDDLPPVSASHLPPMPASAPTPAAIGPYRVCGVIGQGGMGVVYRAEQERTDRPVALKLLPAERNTPALRRRFEHETAVLARLSHPGIAQILHAGVAETPTGALPYFAMELVDGQPLTSYADAHRLDARARIGLVLQVCDATQHAHQQGVVHRDLKPANILVGADGRVKVLDFGVAKLVGGGPGTRSAEVTRVGDVIGTLEYMSPEQARGRPDDVDTRADVYALGVILYELLAGRRPLDLRGRALADQFDAVANVDPPDLGAVARSFRGDLSTIVAKAMAKDRARRYPAVSELAADLRRFLADEPVLARPASAWYLLGKFARKRRPLLAGGSVAAAAVVTGVVLAGLFWLDRQEQRRQREAAERTALDLRIGDAAGHGRWREVLELAGAALAAGHPDADRLRLAQVRAYRAIGDRRADIILGELAARPDLAPADRADAQLRQAEGLMAAKHPGARQSLEAALAGRLSPADREYAQGLLAPSVDKALSRYRAAVAMDAAHRGARIQLSYLLIFSAQWDEARAALLAAEAFYPDDPSVGIVRLLHDSLRGDAESVRAATDRLIPTIGSGPAADLGRAAEAVRSTFSRPLPDEDAQFEGLGRFLAAVSALDPGLRSPPVPTEIEHCFRLLAEAPARFRDPAYATEVEAAARYWGEVVALKAWGDLLAAQHRMKEAVDAYAEAVAARTIFPETVNSARLSHILAVETVRPPGSPAQAAVLEDARELAARLRGPAAVRLKEPAPNRQTVGWVLVDIAWRYNDHGLARALLDEWERVEPDSPIAAAERAQVEFHDEAYGRAIEAARRAKALGLQDSVLLQNMGAILTQAPQKLKAQADRFAPPTSPGRAGY